MSSTTPTRSPSTKYAVSPPSSEVRRGVFKQARTRHCHKPERTGRAATQQHSIENMPQTPHCKSRKTRRRSKSKSSLQRIITDCLSPSSERYINDNYTPLHTGTSSNDNGVDVRALPLNLHDGNEIAKPHANHPCLSPPLTKSDISALFPSTPDQFQEEREQALRDYKVTIEYKHLKSHAPGGVYLIPSLTDLRHFFGVIFVRRGYFTNGIFKFQLILPPQYNDINTHPEIIFSSHVFNPYVDEATGRLDIKSAYPKWDPSKHYLVTVLTFLKKIFYSKTFDDAKANPTAKELALQNPQEYRQRVDECVRKSQKEVYDNKDDDNVAKFTEEALGHRVLRDLLKANVKDPASVSKNALLSMISKASHV